MSNGYNQRGGGRPNFSNSRGGGYNGNNRGGSRGMVPYSSHLLFLALNVFNDMVFVHENSLNSVLRELLSCPFTCF